MLQVHKRIVTDEALRPVAVQIDYADWLQIEEALTGVTLVDAKPIAMEGLRHALDLVRRYVPAGRSLSEELIAERREAAAHE